jgi:uncharacterized protein YgbK (DUF1537 family)
MRMTSLRLLADDLTGALDSAAPFSLWGPVQVAWSDEAFTPGQDLVALDGETRDMAPDAARDVVRRWLSHGAPARVTFKKIDSLLRGNTLAELDVCCQTTRYATVVVAPAFPAQQRITRGATQQARDDRGAPWRDIGPKLTAVLPGARSVAAGEMRGGAGVVVCDAETQEHLDEIARCPGWERPVLWCGTSGLARALSGAPPGIFPGPARNVLVLLGSEHAATQAQLADLEGARPGTQVAGVNTDAAGTAAGLAGTLATRRIASLGMAPPLSAAAAADWFSEVFDHLVGLCRPDLIVCGGGETARRLCAAAGVRSLLVRGEWKPGFPVSIIEGGPWAGARLVTKAGAFGSPGALTALAAAVLEDLAE